MYRFFILIALICSLNAHAFWWDDYKLFGGPKHTLNKHALIFRNYSLPDSSFEPIKENIVSLNQVGENDVPYPYITFYSEPDLKNVVLKINEKGLVYKDKVVCKPSSIEGLAFLCPNPLMKFIRVSNDYKYWEVTVEFDNFHSKEIFETTYEGAKVYFRLSDSVGSSKKIDFDFSDMNIVQPEFNWNPTKPMIVSFYWIRPSSKSIREKFYAESPSAAKLLVSVSDCINNRNYKCVMDMSQDTLVDFFKHLYKNLSNSKGKKFGSWFYQTPSMLDALQECLKNGDVTSRDFMRESIVKNNKRTRFEAISLMTSKKWKTGDGVERDKLRCGIVIIDHKVGEEWVPTEFKIISDTVEYL
jgi:hypothetical protein